MSREFRKCPGTPGSNHQLESFVALGISLKMIILFPIPDENYFVPHKCGGQENTWSYRFLQAERRKAMFQSSRISGSRKKASEVVNELLKQCLLL